MEEKLFISLQSFNESFEIVIDHDQRYDIVISTEDDILSEGDEIWWIRNDVINSKGPGNECSDLHLHSTDSIPPDHGGVLHKILPGVYQAGVHLLGEIDTIDPLTTDNEEDTGTFHACLRISGIVFYYPNLSLHTVHKPPALPPTSPLTALVSKISAR